MKGLRVIETGPQALVQDAGRPGWTGVGVSPSGAADRAAYASGNRALGNRPGAAAVEVLLGALRVGVGGDGLWMCVTGAPCGVRVDEREVGSHAPFVAPPGSQVTLGQPTSGLRSYLCVRGGIDVPAVLGSRSTDLLSGLGPEPLSAGRMLAVGWDEGPWPGVDQLVPPSPPAMLELRAVRGPRADWLEDADLLTRPGWRVTERSNRVGLRLAGDGGAALRHARDAQLPSEGIWRGAVQVPPGGEPVVFLADHPVTGGYPVAAVVVDDDVDLAAQARPGQEVRLRWVDP